MILIILLTLLNSPRFGQTGIYTVYTVYMDDTMIHGADYYCSHEAIK